MNITPDEIVFWKHGFFELNAVIVYTWGIMLLMVVGSWLITRKLSTGVQMSRWQNMLEVIVVFLRNEIRDVVRQDPDQYLVFIGTLFLYIFVANILSILPLYIPPTGSLSTTAALAGCVFIAVPIYGIAERGVGGYLHNYIEPTFFMLPFNIIGELSRTLALAVRLFGNVMSGTVVVGLLLSLAPLFFPILMHLLGLLTGVIQAYIFAILAMVYIGAGTRAHHEEEEISEEQKTEKEEK